MTYMHVPAQTDRARLWAILCLTASIAFAMVPFFATPFGGFEADRFPVPVTDLPIQPAGWAFSIWGVIYLWLILSTGYGLFKRDDDARWTGHRPWLFVSLSVGAAWIPVANVSPIWATVLILVMLVTALVALAKAPIIERAWARWPIGLYAGWLTAASFVSLATITAGYGIASPELASWVALPIAIIVAAAITWRVWTWTYPLAVMWAAVGIAIAAWPSGFAWGAAGGACLMMAFASMAVARRM
ncbi:hypothetical protein [Gymnodinialimonas hymeniacidonis]|uniref:hypothetical protein n=1 Tax=Gymnodinialimonas hymeniacidonis TaxID=3126508 RepID=UPI0034C66626